MPDCSTLFIPLEQDKFNWDVLSWGFRICIKSVPSSVSPWSKASLIELFYLGVKGFTFSKKKKQTNSWLFYPLQRLSEIVKNFYFSTTEGRLGPYLVNQFYFFFLSYSGCKLLPFSLESKNFRFNEHTWKIFTELFCDKIIFKNEYNLSL